MIALAAEDIALVADDKYDRRHPGGSRVGGKLRVTNFEIVKVIERALTRPHHRGRTHRTRMPTGFIQLEVCYGR